MAISGVSKNGYCTACGACVAACPFSALEMCEGVGGEPFPYVDAELCCDCGKCVTVCPSNHPASLRHPLRTYAAWSNDDEDLAKSSSAGLAAAICRHVLRRGGVAFGCVASEGSAHCAMADDEAGAEAFRGSKYVYSEPLDSYQRVRKQLRSGRRTVFVSVPCQVAALKSYLGGKPDGLLCVDLICHGTPPMSRLREHLDRACPDGWDSFSFRGERDFSMCAYKGGTLVYERSCFEDEYFLVFVTALSFRECCYECPYARNERVGDLTIGDFWGLDRSTLLEQPPKKVSLCLANTERGVAFVRGLAGEVHFEERSFEEADNPEQTNLHEPSARARGREKFLTSIERLGFDRAVRSTFVWKRYLLRKVRHRARAFLKGLME